ncbi:hypothetical protein GCM10027019_01410 [Melaminivora jejuensis]
MGFSGRILRLWVGWAGRGKRNRAAGAPFLQRQGMGDGVRGTARSLRWRPGLPTPGGARCAARIL